MSQAVEILSSKGLELALQQQPAVVVTELPDFLTSRQAPRICMHLAVHSIIHSCFGEISAPAAICLRKLHSFIENHARPGEREWLSHVAPTGQSRWQPVPVIERLKEKAKVIHAKIWMPIFV
jgi:hypothetical protein